MRPFARTSLSRSLSFPRCSALHAGTFVKSVLDQYTLADIAAEQAKLSRVLGLAARERPLVRLARKSHA